MSAIQSFDKLTATYTHDVFNLFLNRFLGKAPFQGILLLDIDDLKYVNRIKSREVGDILITLVVRNIYNNVPRNAIVGRVGEDEFAVFLPELSNFEELRKIGDKLVSIHRNPIRYRNEEFFQTVSVGGLRLTEDVLKD
ncbi:MAG: GGDEF domain-containing protein, partial [Bacillota bacterium]|nr:GGDEF domain-containing protein [Bacillota bacterium]